MAEQGGFGMKVKITVGTTLTTIANLLDAEFPKFNKFLAEQTGHDATSGYAEYIDTGKRGLDSFKMTLGWDSESTTHAAIVTAFSATTTVNMSIEDPGAVEIISFAAHIKSILRISKQEEGYQAEIEVQPTGLPTIT